MALMMSESTKNYASEVTTKYILSNSTQSAYHELLAPLEPLKNHLVNTDGIAVCCARHSPTKAVCDELKLRTFFKGTPLFPVASTSLPYLKGMELLPHHLPPQTDLSSVALGQYDSNGIAQDIVSDVCLKKVGTSNCKCG